MKKKNYINGQIAIQLEKITENTVFLSLGSNIGDRLVYLQKASKLISEKMGLVKTKSSVYETESWGLKNQAQFLNQIIALRTILDPLDCLKKCQEIEAMLGRERKEVWGARTIDVDVIFFNDLIINEKDLSVPHPRMHHRKFVLQPLCDIAPEFVHPVLRQTSYQLLILCSDSSHTSLYKS